MRWLDGITDSMDVRGRLRGFLELRRPWGFSPEERRGSQGASRAAPGKSGLHARGEGERVMALESLEGTRASRHIEEGLSRSFSGGGGKPSFPSPSAGDLRELPRVPLRGEGSCQAERPRFPGPLLRRTRGPEPSSKATLWLKAQHEGLKKGLHW